MTTKLISSIEFTPLWDFITKIQNDPNIDIFSESAILSIINRKDFGQLTPQLGFFVPVIDGVVVEEPTVSCCGTCDCPVGNYRCSAKYGEDYDKAKESVLFEGWYSIAPNVVSNSHIAISFYKNSDVGLSEHLQLDVRENIGSAKTLEDLTKYQLKLTASAIARINK